jgi:hypothetical protein
LVAYAPVNAPVFSFDVFRVTTSCFAARSTYARTSARCSSPAIWSTSGCSGASTRYVAPNTVSGRVVNTRISTGVDTTSPDIPALTVALPANDITSCTRNTISAPSDFPIQLRCAVSVLSDQSSRSRLASSRPA